MHFGSFRLSSFIKTVGAFSWFMRPKTKLFAVEFRRILKVFCLQVLQEKLAQFHDLCVQKRSCLPWNLDAFWKFSACKIYRKIVGAIPRFVRPKTKLFSVKFRCILEVLYLRVLQEKLWAQFHNFCVQKWSCLLWNSDAFWRFSTCKIYRKSCGRNSTICASKNEAVCWEVQTHFGSFRLKLGKKKFWVYFPDLYVQKWSCLLWNAGAFWKFSLCKVYEKN